MKQSKFNIINNNLKKSVIEFLDFPSAFEILFTCQYVKEKQLLSDSQFNSFELVKILLLYNMDSSFSSSNNLHNFTQMFTYQYIDILQAYLFYNIKKAKKSSYFFIEEEYFSNKIFPHFYEVFFEIKNNENIVYEFDNSSLISDSQLIKILKKIKYMKNPFKRITNLLIQNQIKIFIHVDFISDNKIEILHDYCKIYNNCILSINLSYLNIHDNIKLDYLQDIFINNFESIKEISLLNEQNSKFFCENYYVINNDTKLLKINLNNIEKINNLIVNPANYDSTIKFLNKTNNIYSVDMSIIIKNPVSFLKNIFEFNYLNIRILKIECNEINPNVFLKFPNLKCFYLSSEKSEMCDKNVFQITDIIYLNIEKFSINILNLIKTIISNNNNNEIFSISSNIETFITVYNYIFTNLSRHLFCDKIKSLKLNYCPFKCKFKIELNFLNCLEIDEIDEYKYFDFMIIKNIRTLILNKYKNINIDKFKNFLKEKEVKFLETNCLVILKSLSDNVEEENNKLLYFYKKDKITLKEFINFKCILNSKIKLLMTIIFSEEDEIEYIELLHELNKREGVSLNRLDKIK